MFDNIICNMQERKFGSQTLEYMHIISIIKTVPIKLPTFMRNALNTSQNAL